MCKSTYPTDFSKIPSNATLDKKGGGVTAERTESVYWWHGQVHLSALLAHMLDADEIRKFWVQNRERRL